MWCSPDSSPEETHQLVTTPWQLEGLGDELKAHAGYQTQGSLQSFVIGIVESTSKLRRPSL